MNYPKGSLGEVTLIGTGGGYGESCVVHLGDDNWIIVDSCEDPITKTPLALDYLTTAGINVATSVKLILCTHWHDDHILGMAKTLDACKTAKFAFARTLDRKKFLQLVELDYQKLLKVGTNSSTVEFRRCLEILNARKDSVIVQAVQDTILYSLNLASGLRSEVIALSPSHYTVECFDKEISQLITNYGSSNTKIQNKTPNSKSVALFIKIGSHRAILGADLEVSTSSKEGWQNIVENSQALDSRATLLKIPHHGSTNGFYDELWEKFLEKNPIAKLTPWNLNSKLPKQEMLHKYASKTESLYMTSLVHSDQPKKRDKHITKYIRSLQKRNLSEVRYKRGIVQCQIEINKTDAKWVVNLFDSAVKASLL